MLGGEVFWNVLSPSSLLCKTEMRTHEPLGAKRDALGRHPSALMLAEPPEVSLTVFPRM